MFRFWLEKNHAFLKIANFSRFLFFYFPLDHFISIHMITKCTQPLNTGALVNAYKGTKQRLFLFDYDVSIYTLIGEKIDPLIECTLV